MATAAASSSFRFRDLPGEIRKKVYRIVLCSFGPPPTTIEPSSFFTPELAKHDIETSILRTSKETYREAYDVMVKSNRFVKITSSRGHSLRGPLKGRAIRMVAIDEEIVHKFKGYVLSIHIGFKSPGKISITHDPGHDPHSLFKPSRL